MTVEDRVKNTSLRLWSDEFSVRWLFTVDTIATFYCAATTTPGSTTCYDGGMRCRPTTCHGLRHEQVYVGFEFSLMLVVADSPAPLMVASASFMDDSKSCSTIFTSC